jgi:hypothetical protein
MKPKLINLMQNKTRSGLIRIIIGNIKNYSNQEYKDFLRELKK